MKHSFVTALLLTGISITDAAITSNNSSYLRSRSLFSNSTRLLGPDIPGSDVRLCSNVIGGSNKMRYCRNRALSSSVPNVERAVIFIPSSGLDAHDYYYNKIMPHLPPGIDDTTNIFVLQFLEEGTDDDGRTVLQRHGLGDEYLYWAGWRSCDNALNRPSHATGGTSSCAMVDFVVRRLIQYNENLKHIVIAGHSAGGQMVNRYALTNDIEGYAKRRGVSMSYLVSSAGSFAFLDEWRPNQSPSHLPDCGCGRGDMSPDCGCNNCDCDKWKYGLDNRNEYASVLSTDAITRNALYRRIYYVVGSEDTDSYANDRCCVWVQGDNHVDAMWKYKDSLMRVWARMESEREHPDGASSFFLPTFLALSNGWMELRGIDHSGRQIFNSDHGHNVLYNLHGTPEGY